MSSGSSRLTDLRKLLQQVYELADYTRSKFDSAPLAIGYYPGHVEHDRRFCEQRDKLMANIKSLLDSKWDSLEYQRLVSRLERRTSNIPAGYSPTWKGFARCRCWWDARDALLETADYLERLLKLESQPEQEQPEELFIENIDSFAKVRDIEPQAVRALLPLDLSENQIQTYLEEIIGENSHQQDWGGEINDLVTSHVTVGGKRLRAVFLLKGNGTRGKLTISKCGKNGDQVVRLADAPADLYIIQHVDEIDERVIYDLKSKVQLKNSKGHRCQMCIINGTDTARILRAYGKM